MEAECAYCKEPVDPDHRDTWHRVCGWERPRRGGGTNHLAMRRRSGAVACPHCLDKLLEGRHPLQLEMLR